MRECFDGHFAPPALLLAGIVEVSPACGPNIAYRDCFETIGFVGVGVGELFVHSFGGLQTGSASEVAQFVAMSLARPHAMLDVFPAGA